MRNEISSQETSGFHKSSGRTCTPKVSGTLKAWDPGPWAAGNSQSQGKPLHVTSLAALCQQHLDVQTRYDVASSPGLASEGPSTWGRSLVPRPHLSREVGSVTWLECIHSNMPDSIV